MIKIGSAWLTRKTHVNSDRASSESLLLQSQLNTLENLMKCVDMNWMSILTGPTSGKTSVVRLLAQLTNNHLVELSMNSAVDTMELLGMNPVPCIVYF